MQTNYEQAQFFENRKGDRLFGIVHRPRGPSRSELGVVFCHPISWEKQNSYRAYSQFSRHLAEAGYASMRFDAYGFGDSDGELVEATIRSQVEDALDAIEWLREAGGCTRFVLVGVRFGAAIAALAAQEASGVDGLVLVSPVANGESYWKELLRINRLGRMTLGQKLLSTSDLLAQLQDEGAVELDGELFSRQFVEELRAIDLSSQVAGFKGRCLLRELASGGSDRESFETFAGVLDERGVRVAASFEEPKEFWVTKSRYAGYLPQNLYKRTVSWLGEVSA